MFVWILNKHLLNSKRSLKNTINVFTTNYDTFIEEALENLKQFYYNGFHGTINKTFSPEYYNYKYFDDMNLNKNFYQEKNHYLICINCMDPLHETIMKKKKN
ncbi:MAG: SIR2 family protein [Spiroplasma phoeniceum]|nr:MAG: SIR2 family protein [Spiroplasma phoeniceum]UZQ32961.1 MAG: SIR2 family protein [Spiroplasma phoeniceum]